MQKQDLIYIQNSIGYHFKNLLLLEQAFTRKSYAAENNEAVHNEVLEFYGDKALDFIVMKKMYEYYGCVSENQTFESSLEESKLSEIKKNLICREMLSGKVRDLGLQFFFKLGKGDVELQAWRAESVQEDLFEAIVGAVAIDSNWNVEALSQTIDMMLNPKYYFEYGFDKEKDYVRLVQQWCQKKYHRLPVYSFFNGVYSIEFAFEVKNAKYQCNLAIGPFNYFKGYGKTQAEARMDAAKKAYDFLERNNLLISLVDEIGCPDFDRAINQLQEMYQKKFIQEPMYDFFESHDENGNPIWRCRCSIKGFDVCCDVNDSSKKNGKKCVAYEMVKLYLNWEDNHND